MTAPAPETIPLTRLSGTQTFVFTVTSSSFDIAHVTVDRTPNQGLNSLPTPTFNALIVEVDALPPGADSTVEANWVPCGGADWTGGTFVTKGVTRPSEELSVRQGSPFVAGTDIRFKTTASTPVRIQGTIAYETVA